MERRVIITSSEAALFLREGAVVRVRRGVGPKARLVRCGSLETTPDPLQDTFSLIVEDECESDLLLEVEDASSLLSESDSLARAVASLLMDRSEAKLAKVRVALIRYCGARYWMLGGEFPIPTLEGGDEEAGALGEQGGPGGVVFGAAINKQ